MRAANGARAIENRARTANRARVVEIRAREAANGARKLQIEHANCKQTT